MTAGKTRGKNHKINRKRFLFLFLALFILKGQAVQAETDPAGNPAETEAAAEGITEDPAGARPGSGRLSYRYEWGQDGGLKGLFSESSLYFQTGKWEIREAVLTLRLKTSGLLDTQLSYFTILLDGQPAETVRIPQGGETSVYTALLPPEAFAEGSGHTVSVEAYLRGAADACEDESSLSAWMTILPDSALELRYDPLPDGGTIADFYQAFVAFENLEEGKCAAATGKDAPDSALTALARILAGVSQNTSGDYERISVLAAGPGQELKGTPYVIYVDRLERLPAYLEQAMTQVQKEYASAGAAVCLLKLPDTDVLLVTGTDDKALQKAGDLLSNPVLLPDLPGTQVKVDAKVNYQTMPEEWDEYIPLTEYGTQVKGNYEQSISFFIDCPTDKRAADSAQLSLDYRYSENLDFDKSLLTVLINGIPAGSRALTKEGADGTSELFKIPEDVGAVGGFTVETRFLLYPAGEWCELTPEELPWAYVANTSMLKWTTVENTEVFFEYYPFPFIRNRAFSDTRVLLPENWGQDELSTMAGILLTMGNWLKGNSGELAVSSGSEIRSAAVEPGNEANLIVIGRASENGWASPALMEYADGGCAHLDLLSDSASLYGVLTVTGKNGGDLPKVLSFLGDSSKLWRVKGDLFYTDGEEIECRYLRKPELTAKPPATTEAEEEYREGVPAVIFGSLFVLLLLSAGMLLLKYGGKGNGR